MPKVHELAGVQIRAMVDSAETALAVIGQSTGNLLVHRFLEDEAHLAFGIVPVLSSAVQVTHRQSIGQTREGFRRHTSPVPILLHRASVSDSKCAVKCPTAPRRAADVR